MPSHIRFTALFFATFLASRAVAFDAVRTGSANFEVMGDSGSVLSFYTISFKPNYGWMGMREPELNKTAQGAIYKYDQDGGKLNWTVDVEGSEDGLTIGAGIVAAVDYPLTYLAMGFKPGDVLAGGKVRVTTVGGESQDIAIPLPASVTPPDVTKVEFFDETGNRAAEIRFEYPADLHVHGDVRVRLISEKILSGQKVGNQFALGLGQPVTFYPSLTDYPPQTDHSTWFAFQPKNTTEPGAIGMQDWLGIPKSALKLQQDQVLRDGKPFKIWGTNVEYADCAPEKEDAEQRSAFFAKYGINGVRLHKLTNPGWEGLGSKNHAAEYEPEKLERFDYFTAQLRKQGVMYGFSPIWDLMVFDGDREKLVAYDEIKKAGGNKPTTKGLVWFARDVQDLHIETLVNLLNHKNPHTGLRYAEDPGLSYVEIQNEEDVFFFTTIPSVVKCPTYQRMFAEQFSDWLKAKYGSQEALEQAWGKDAINTFGANEGAFPGEDMDRQNIFPTGNPWMWDNQGKDGPRARRLQDTARFLYECQNNFYARVVAALRDMGYQGPITCSNWQAGSTTGHFLNLASDAEFGMVDRHNYMGGAQGNPGHVMSNGHRLANHTVLNDPGSGLLSVGMQQVAGRPFVYSEWLAVPPVEWAAADTAIIAIYGYGLQDWDMSYHFASNGNGFTPTLQYPGTKKFNNLTPLGIGLYPVLSRMLLRGDIAPGKPIATRRLTINEAIDQSYDFENKAVQQHDIKSFSGTPSHNALAVGRVLVDFVETSMASTIDDWQAFKNGDTITSNTGQLRWTAPGGERTGFFSIDTKGTQGVVGFTGARKFELGDLTIETVSPYGVILTTAKSKEGTLATDKEVLLVAVARTHNTGMNMSNDMIFNVGEAPMILEPVKAELKFKRRDGTVTVLDHDGMPTDRIHLLEDGMFQLDTGRDKALYYLVEFK